MYESVQKSESISKFERKQGQNYHKTATEKRTDLGTEWNIETV